MGRRRASFADDLTELTSRVPWWVGVLLALVSFVILRSVAAQPVTIDPKAPSFVGILFKGLATVGQFALPIIFLAGAGMSAFRRQRAGKLIADVRERNDAQAVNEMSWREFEVLVGEAFRRQGYGVVETGGGGADGGVDLVLTRDREKYLVQCKQWKAYKVGVQVVRELYGLMSAHGAAGGFVVSSGTFTDESRRFAEGRNVHLIDGAKLNAMIGAVQAKRTAAGVVDAAPRATAVAEPKCPRCGSGMAKRLAKRGSNAGSYFWGCAMYPDCKGVLPINQREPCG
jgi:restriction system protein